MKNFLFVASLLICQLTLAHDPDLKHLPLGDGKISTAPKKNWIWACRVDPNAGGAFRAGDWIHSDGTFDLTAKPHVPGAVSWNRKFSIEDQGSQRVFIANDLPDHPTGTFPIPSSSQAYHYDRNPNRIQEQTMKFSLLKDPVLAQSPQCAPGAVGILLSGAVLFNALDAPGRDAVAHETQDSCEGHPQESGVYHYHSLSSCVKDQQGNDGHSQLVGYAIDGFGIYGRHDVGGKVLTSADLDECHGHTHEVEWNGKRTKIYHYHATWDFPYTIGCLRGNYDRDIVRVISGPPPSRGLRGEPNPGPGGADDRPRGRHPDLSVVAKKLGISEDKLRQALGPPPPDISAAARSLGISEETLRKALGPPPPPAE